ncbi:MAG: lysine exporter LysO family protein [Anaerotruncus sp.]|nr:lysine exporter LysO family protein [Anaerotruncus sp.]
MFEVLLFMIVGMLLGLKVFPERLQKYNSWLQTVVVCVLIFLMGVGLGKSPTFFADLASVGGKALIFAVLPALLSIVCVYLLTRYLFKGEEKE